jgi:hypothetical protein
VKIWKLDIKFAARFSFAKIRIRAMVLAAPPLSDRALPDNSWGGEKEVGSYHSEEAITN